MTEERAVHLDPDLGIEAYRFTGIMQRFPNHFHDYYVVGYIRDGLREMTCGGGTYTVGAGDLVLIGPGVIHACAQIDDRAMDWRGLHIPEAAMSAAVREITGREALPQFRPCHVPGWPGVEELARLCENIAEGAPALQREEGFLFLIQRLLAQFGGGDGGLGEPGPEVAAVCRYIDGHCGETVRLEQLAGVAGMNKFTLLRTFTRQRGITPYQYLETVRVSRAKALLEAGVPPVQAAVQTGFADQSHMTRHFKALIGVTPGQYQDIFREERDGE